MAKRTRMRTKKKGKTPITTRVQRLEKKMAAQTPETKYYEQSSTNNPITNDFNAMQTPLRNIGQGDSDVGERVGDTLYIKSVNYRMRVFLAAGASAKQLRVIWFTFKNNPDSLTTAYATTGNFLMESALANTTEAPLAPYDWDNNGKGTFKVHYDRLFNITPNNGAAVATYGSYHIFNFRIRLPRQYRKVQYSAGSAYVTKNELFMLIIGPDDNTMVYDWVGRVTYTDT